MQKFQTFLCICWIAATFWSPTCRLYIEFSLYFLPWNQEIYAHNFYNFIIDWLPDKNDPRWSALKRNAQQGSLFGNGCVQGSSRRRANDPMPSYPSLSYMEPFSLIVEVKSPRVWDVICSTLVLYRSTLGLDRGVGVFKGDYTQRQGWLYWRSFPVTLILYPNTFTFKLQTLPT